MDVRGLTEANKEVEGLKKLMRDRENSHAKELDSVRDNNRKTVDSLKDSQNQNLAHVKEHSDKSVEENKENYDRALARTEDNYEKTLHRERHESYNRLGKLQNDHTREQEIEYNNKKKQIEGLLASKERDNTRERTNREEEIGRLRGDFTDKSEGMRLEYKNKLDAQNRARDVEIGKIREEARHQVDHRLQESADELNQNKRQLGARTRMINDELVHERDSMRSANMEREQGLAKEHGERERDLSIKNQKALETAKARQDETFARRMNDQNFLNSVKEGGVTRQIAEITHDSRLKEQQAKSQIREIQNEMEKSGDFEKTRAETQKDLDEKRHRQEMFLNTEAVRRNSDAANQQLRERYEDVMHDMKEKQQSAYQSQNSTFQKQLAIQDQRTSNLRASLENEKSMEVGTQSVKHANEKERLVRTYEQRQSEADQLRQRQMDEQAKGFHTRQRLAQEAHGEALFKTNREATMRLFNAREAHKQSVDELEMMNRYNEEVADQGARERVKRVTDTYHRSLEHQQKNFTAATDELRDDSAYRYTKMKHDSEQERRLQLIDLQMKNRAAMQAYENKLSEQKDSMESELQKLKMDHDKQIRDQNKRMAEIQDRERSAHKFELENKDRQLAEKLKLQEEAFRQQIENIKRSHELAIKKG